MPRGARAAPGPWSARNADLGRYSTPSYLLDAEVVTATRRRVTVRVENGLACDFGGAVTLPLAACPGVRVENGEVVRRRVGDDRQDVRVAFEVPAGRTLSVTAGCASNPAARRDR